MVCGDGGVACVCPSVCGCASGIRGRIVCVIVCVLVCVCVCVRAGVPGPVPRRAGRWVRGMSGAQKRDALLKHASRDSPNPRA